MYLGILPYTQNLLPLRLPRLGILKRPIYAMGIKDYKRDQVLDNNQSAL